MARLRKRENRAASRLLGAEAETLKALRAATKRTVDHLVVHAAHDERHTAHARVQNAKRHLQWVLPFLAQGLAAAVREGRTKAREAGRDELATHVHKDALEEDDRTTDAPRAYSSAAALVAAWGSAAMKVIARWRRQEKKAEREKAAAEKRRASLAAELAATAEELEPRLRRTAATEAAHAFAEARSQVIAAHAEIVAPTPRELPPNVIPFPGGPGGPGGGDIEGGGTYREPGAAPPRMRILKVWSAILDARTCKDCALLHGTVVNAHDEFPGGDPPRHPFCRCLPVMIEVPAESANEDVRALMRGA